MLETVFIKVPPMKGVIRFRKLGKLAPRFVRPFRIVERISKTHRDYYNTYSVRRFSSKTRFDHCQEANSDYDKR